MNANELADELDNMLKAIGLTDNRVPAMLRQQQADLKDADKYALELERLYEDAKAEIEALKKRLENPVGAFGIERAYEAGKQTAQAEIEEMKTAVRSFFNDYFKKQSKKIDEQQAEIEALKVGDIQWSHAFDLAKIEIADLKTEIEALEILVDELAGYKASYENGIRMEDGYGLN